VPRSHTSETPDAAYEWRTRNRPQSVDMRERVHGTFECLVRGIAKNALKEKKEAREKNTKLGAKGWKERRHGGNAQAALTARVTLAHSRLLRAVPRRDAPAGWVHSVRLESAPRLRVDVTLAAEASKTTPRSSDRQWKGLNKGIKVLADCRS
jgi:hypothetical protein